MKKRISQNNTPQYYNIEIIGHAIYTASTSLQLQSFEFLFSLFKKLFFIFYKIMILIPIYANFHSLLYLVRTPHCHGNDFSFNRLSVLKSVVKLCNLGTIRIILYSLYSLHVIAVVLLLSFICYAYIGLTTVLK